jgi:hypothetical protein
VRADRRRERERERDDNENGFAQAFGGAGGMEDDLYVEVTSKRIRVLLRCCPKKRLSYFCTPIIM